MRKIHTEADAGDLAETVSRHGASGTPGRHSTTERGRRLVREYVAGLTPPAREYASAKRVLAEIGWYTPQANETVDTDVVRDVGAVLAAIRDGDAPDGYLPAVDVTRWSDSNPATWVIEVSER